MDFFHFVKTPVQDENWLERTVGKDENQRVQQYVYVVEVNITLKNGLSVPLMSEFLYYDGNTKPNKQDCEFNGTTLRARGTQKCTLDQ